MSIIITMLTFAFSLLALEKMLTRKNPTLIQTESDLEVGEKFDVANSDFMIAVATEQWLTGAKDDPRYINWTMLQTVFIDNVEYRYWWPMHPCTDEEFARFYPVEEKAAIKVAKLHANNQFRCFDWS